MMTSWPFGLMIVTSAYFVLGRGGSVDAADHEVGYTPVQTSTSPGLFSVIEENVDFSPHGNDRHYTNGVKFAYTTGPLCDNSLLNAPIRLLGDCTFLFSRPTSETDDRLQWNILGQSIFTPKDHLASNPSLNDRPYAGWLYTGL
jgi:lipid A 3-O-deacylase